MRYGASHGSRQRRFEAGVDATQMFDTRARVPAAGELESRIKRCAGIVAKAPALPSRAILPLSFAFRGYK
jgi:hypothetical protein